KFVFAVMADDQMFQQCLQVRGKSLDLRDLLMQHFQFDDHVSQQLAARGIGKGPGKSQLMHFTDIVQESPGKQQVAVDHHRIIAASQVAKAKERDHVIEQTTQVSVVQ